jgi:AraC-like DNA-binding protein
MQRKTSLQSLPLGNVDPFKPTPARPVRTRHRTVPQDTHLQPHAHPWAQLAYCASGLMQVSVAQQVDTTFIVPPSRAVWIPPGARHAVTVLEAAQLQTLYLHASTVPPGWNGARVLVVSGLLRELITEMETPRSTGNAARHAALTTLVLDELASASTLQLGVPLPRDKRLRALCEAVLRAPGERATLAAWASDMGASERTAARLFREELRTSWQHWRQQALLAHALPSWPGGPHQPGGHGLRLRQRQRFRRHVQGRHGPFTQLFPG